MGNRGRVDIGKTRTRQTRFERIETMTRNVEGIQTAGVAHGRANGQGLAAGTGAKVHHHFATLGVQHQCQQLRAFVLHLDGAAVEGINLGQRRLAVHTQTDGRERRGLGLDAGFFQFLAQIGALIVERVDTQV